MAFRRVLGAPVKFRKRKVLSHDGKHDLTFFTAAVVFLGAALGFFGAFFRASPSL